MGYHLKVSWPLHHEHGRQPLSAVTKAEWQSRKWFFGAGVLTHVHTPTSLCVRAKWADAPRLVLWQPSRPDKTESRNLCQERSHFLLCLLPFLSSHGISLAALLSCLAQWLICLSEHTPTPGIKLLPKGYKCMPYIVHLVHRAIRWDWPFIRERLLGTKSDGWWRQCSSSNVSVLLIPSLFHAF